MTSGRALSVRSPGDLAALVPHLVGFRPDESLVAVSLRGPRRRVGLTLRADLADAGALPGRVVRAVLRDGAASCALLVHTAAASGADHPHASLVDALERALADRGTGVLEALLVRDGRWWSYRCSGPCCPPGGTPLEPDSPVVLAVASELAFEGRAVLASREDLVAGLQPRPPLGAALALRLQDQAEQDLAVAARTDRAAVVRRELQRWRAALDAWERRPGVLPPGDVAALAVGLQATQVRDTVARWGLERPEPLLGLLGQLCQAVVPPHDAALCSLLAWVAYSEGNGALALVALQRALASEPGHGLATLLLAALDGLVPPAQLREVLRRAG